jgi:hypothetical protein
VVAVGSLLVVGNGQAQNRKLCFGVGGTPTHVRPTDAGSVCRFGFETSEVAKYSILKFLALLAKPINILNTEHSFL